MFDGFTGERETENKIVWHPQSLLNLLRYDDDFETING